MHVKTFTDLSHSSRPKDLSEREVYFLCDLQPINLCKYTFFDVELTTNISLLLLLLTVGFITHSELIHYVLFPLANNFVLI
jgi:hypothetical protein